MIRMNHDFKFSRYVFALLFTAAGQGVVQAVDVEVNLNQVHEVGGLSTFDRSKFITIHSDHTESDWQDGVRGADNFTDDLLADFILGRDVYFGRNTGLISGTRRWYTTEGATGWANPTSIINRGRTTRASYETETAIHAYESRSSQNVMCAQYNGFWPNGVDYNGWSFSQADTAAEPFGTATGDYMGRFMDEFYDNRGTQTGPPTPAFVEIINEPDWHILDWQSDSDYGSVPASKIWDFHNGVADAIRSHNTNSLIGGFVTTFPDHEEQNFGEWNTEWKSFIDIAGANMDFWSLHLYDFPVFYGNDRYRKGSNLEAMFDMIDYYSEAQLGVSRPYVISEYGSQTHEYNQQEWSAERDWMRLKSLTSQLMTFMDRPHLMLKTIPFTVVKAEWGRNTYPYPPRLMRQANEPASYTGEWVYTELVKFYDLWANVNGERVYISSTDPDVQTDAYVDGNKVYVILNNIVTGTRTVDLSLVELHGNAASSMDIKHLYWDGSAVIMDETSHTSALPTQVVIGSEAAMVLEYTFPAPVNLDQTMVESKHFASTYLQTIQSGATRSFEINGVSKGASGEAVLRVGIGRAHAKSKQPTVLVNGVAVTVPTDIMGFESDGSAEFFGTLLIPVPYSLLQANNSVSITFPDTGGHISTVALRLFTSGVPDDGSISIDYHEIMGSDVVLGFTNGPVNSFFSLYSKTNLMDITWTTNQTGLPTDASGAGSVTNPIIAPQEFYRLFEGEAPYVPPTGVLAMFDWAETTGSGLSKWNSGYGYTETDNGVTMLHGERSTTGDGQPYAIKFAYGAAVHDYKPGTFTMNYGGSAVNFIVNSIDISQASGTDADSTKYVRGMLGTTVQWEVVAPENGIVSTYTAAASGDMGLEIDTIEWHAGWIDGGGNGLESTIDNLMISVDAP